MSLAQLVDRGERFANALDQLGVPQGCAVGVLSENRAEYPVVDIGLGALVAETARAHLVTDADVGEPAPLPVESPL